MFLYFAPRLLSSIPPELQYAFDGKSFSHCQTMAGPGGSGSGTVMASPTVAADRVRYVPAEQTWKRIPGTDMFCGKWNDTKPTPSELQRPELIQGHPVELDDGSRWQCAIARGFDSATGSTYSPLPRSLSYDEATGKWLSDRFEKRFERFVDLACAYVLASETADAENRFAFDEVDELAIYGLTANYRLSAVELSFFDDAYSVRARKSLIQAILDFPTIAHWNQKKTDAASDGFNTSPGLTQ
jgi:hypothetical protein